MDTPNENIGGWNLRGLNSIARQDLLRDTVRDERLSLLFVEEIKLAVIDDWFIMRMLGLGYKYFSFPQMVREVAY